MALPLLPGVKVGAGAAGSIGGGLVSRTGLSSAASTLRSTFAGTPLRAGLSGLGLGQFLSVEPDHDNPVTGDMRTMILVAVGGIVALIILLQMIDSGPSPVPVGGL